MRLPFSTSNPLLTDAFPEDQGFQLLHACARFQLSIDIGKAVPVALPHERFVRL